MRQSGIHHVTAIARRARRNIDFYTEVLGQRMVKKTVNFDNPASYHFYYGDRYGAPGSILTFFPREQAAPGQPGCGEVGETAFRIPYDAADWWRAWLSVQGILTEPEVERFGVPVLRFRDPDGLRLALVGTEGVAEEPAWGTCIIPAEYAIRGLAGATLAVADPARTAAILTDVLGFAPAGEEAGILRFQAAGAALGGVIDLRRCPASAAQPGHGSVHHIAFRAADDAAQAAMAERLVTVHGISPTEPRDRIYFRSIYFHEPGGVLFEIATDEPGFAVDEPERSLGRMLQLPAFLEARRAQIVAALPALA